MHQEKSVLIFKGIDIEEYNIKISIVRGLDYYKGTVFEIEAPMLGAEKQIDFFAISIKIID